MDPGVGVWAELRKSRRMPRHVRVRRGTINWAAVARRITTWNRRGGVHVEGAGSVLVGGGFSARAVHADGRGDHLVALATECVPNRHSGPDSALD